MTNIKKIMFAIHNDRWSNQRHWHNASKIIISNISGGEAMEDKG